LIKGKGSAGAGRSVIRNAPVVESARQSWRNSTPEHGACDRVREDVSGLEMSSREAEYVGDFPVRDRSREMSRLSRRRQRNPSTPNSRCSIFNGTERERKIGPSWSRGFTGSEAERAVVRGISPQVGFFQVKNSLILNNERCTYGNGRVPSLEVHIYIIFIFINI